MNLSPIRLSCCIFLKTCGGWFRSLGPATCRIRWFRPRCPADGPVDPTRCWPLIDCGQRDGKLGHISESRNPQSANVRVNHVGRQRHLVSSPGDSGGGEEGSAVVAHAAHADEASNRRQPATQLSCTETMSCHACLRAGRFNAAASVLERWKERRRYFVLLIGTRGMNPQFSRPESSDFSAKLPKVPIRRLEACDGESGRRRGDAYRYGSIPRGTRHPFGVVRRTWENPRFTEIFFKPLAGRYSN